MFLSSCASASRGRRPRRIDRRQLATLAGVFAASIPAGVLGYMLVEDARIAMVFALLVAITLLSLVAEPVGRHR